MYDILKHSRVLELDKILEMLAEKTSCEDAATLARSIVPSTDIFEVNRLINMTDEAYILTERYASPSYYSLKNVKGAVTRAAAGASLSAGELLDIAEGLRTYRSLKDWFGRSEQSSPSLNHLFDGLTANRFLEDRIFTSIISPDEISDHASTALGDIRRKKRAMEASVREKLEKIIRSSTYQKYLQEAVITMRSGRFVVPVKSECRSSVPGLVHDTSSTGATVFIEPSSVVEANNDIKVLISKEEAEIDRILAEISAIAGGFADSICVSYDLAVEINLVFAKASLAYSMKAVKPIISNDGSTLLRRARHPLIDKNRVVPIDIEIGNSFDTLVVTGPNTGGKTVTLKTLGLLTLMTMCGLMIPVSEESRISIFDQVMADIGDEQSIEQSLSTFSSHMVNIIEILSDADERTLVLLDELGAGTDPIEGAALAMAIIERLREKGCRVAATTHYSELKSYAIDTAGVENASCEFDVQSLRPTYRLMIGVPGRSNAFAISERLGLPSEIVARADALIADNDARLESVVRTLEEAKHSADKERAEAQKLRQMLDEAEKKAADAVSAAEEKSKKIIEKANSVAENIIEKATRGANAMIDEIDRIRKEKSRDNDDRARRARAAMKKGVASFEKGEIEREKSDYKLPRPLKIGDRVRLADVDKEGDVLTLPDGDGNLFVQAGIIRTKVNISNLRLIENATKKADKSLGRRTLSRSKEPVKTELDLRGMTAEEAIMELERFVDSAVLSGINVVTVIHGKGTGVLRRAVAESLKANKNVRTYRLGVFGEGEDGVTIADLK
ncbi:MAG: endonuclease MutS2 [Clostridia bacterium]|nr:endonuclease MutS2 [Clostridia bacterium]